MEGISVIVEFAIVRREFDWTDGLRQCRDLVVALRSFSYANRFVGVAITSLDSIAARARARAFIAPLISRGADGRC